MVLRTISFAALVSAGAFSCSPRAPFANASPNGRATHHFELGRDEFLLDGKPFQIRSGEMPPARIPAEYWRQRIRMAKAMGLNTIAAYVFWNYQEPQEGKFDFTTGNHDIAKFFRICQEEGMWVLLRPGPYCCAEWDFGGIPPYLLKYPDIKVRCMDPRYIAAAKRYLEKLADQLRPLQVTHGGPILMLQLENEYGSYGNDRKYIGWLHDFWRSHGFDIPFCTADGPTDFMLEAGTWPGCAVGLNAETGPKEWELANKIVPGVPVMSTEIYPGWLTHWGEKWATRDTDSIVSAVKFLMDNKRSFNLYVVHGGTNFGFSAGANSGGKGYEPDVTSYDYDAPITEQGKATPKYYALRDLLGSYLPKGSLAPVPPAIHAISIPPIPMQQWTTLFDHLPEPKAMVQPLPFEAIGQYTGMILYRTRLIGHKTGTLTVRDLHDYALVFVDGKFVGTLDRREGRQSIALPPPTSANPVLDILAEGMGRINYAQDMIDRKGITDRVVLEGMTLMNWEAFQFPLDDAWVGSLAQSAGGYDYARIYRGKFTLDRLGDTYFDLTGYRKGMAWVNGHNLGRYWEIGPQHRLYCPASWLRHGDNTITVLDLLPSTGPAIPGFEKLEG